jgi:hypothetical protein
MPMFSARGFVRAIAVAAVLGAAGAASAGQGSPTAVKGPSATGTTEVTGQYRGYAGRFMTVWLDGGKRMRFTVDVASLPDWKKRFSFGEQVVVTYRDLGTRRLPLAIGMRKAEAPARKR